MPFLSDKRYAELLSETARLRRENQRLSEENAQLRATVDDLRRENAQLKETVAQLMKRIEELERSGKRQAAPFSKGDPKANPQKPGRKEGHPPANRPIPAPETITKIVEVPLPEVCQHCQGSLRGNNGPQDEAVHPQYQEDIRVEVLTTQFNVHTGTCPHCGKRVQGRHPEQISDALGAAGVHLGPNVHALALEMKNRLGVSFGKLRDFFQTVMGLPISPGGLAQARQRFASKFVETYLEIQKHIEASSVVYIDETGWRIGGHPAWLWVATNDAATLYLVHETRGHEVVEILIGESFRGILSSDCFCAYDPVEVDNKSKCAAHFLKAFKELKESNHGRALEFPRKAAQIFKDAIELQSHRDLHPPPRYARLCRGIETRMDRLLEATYTNPGNARLANRPRTHRAHLFTFLYHPEVQPTNNPAERALRPAVIARKLSAGNRTRRGAMAYAIFACVIQTCRQRGIDFLNAAKQVLLSPESLLIDLRKGALLTPAGTSP